MRDVLAELMDGWRAGGTVAMATVVHTIRSAPRPAGASMLVLPDGTASGSLSGGCVEAAVYELALEVVAEDRPTLQRFGYSDDEAFAVGLTCGGIIDVFVEAVSRESFPELEGIAVDVSAGRPVAIATVIEHPDPTHVGRRIVVRSDGVEGSLGSTRTDSAVGDDVRGLLEAGTTTIVTYGPDGERMDTGMRVFVSSFQPKPRMIVFGAIDFAAAVARLGVFLGYRVAVCDARPIFATKARFPDADEVVVSWPHHYFQRQLDEGQIDSRTVVCVLTHDPKFDVPVLALALRLEGATRPAYIGAMGSRLTHDDRLERLRATGLDDENIALLSSPIGLDLGGRTPEETAVSVMAEIIALRWGGSGDRLTETDVRVHHEIGR